MHMYTLEFLSINLAKTFHWLDADEKRSSSIVCVCVMLLISCLLFFSFFFLCFCFSVQDASMYACSYTYMIFLRRDIVKVFVSVCVCVSCLFVCFFFHSLIKPRRERERERKNVLIPWDKTNVRFVWCLYWCFLFLLFFRFFSFHQEKKINFREREREKKGLKINFVLTKWEKQKCN